MKSNSAHSIQNYKSRDFLQQPPIEGTKKPVYAQEAKKLYTGDFQDSPDNDAQRLYERLNRGMLRLATSEIEVKGELPTGGAVVCSNHPSPIDGPAAFGIPGINLRPVATDHGAFRNAFLEWSGCIMTQKGQVVETAADYVKEGGNLWIAPAGTTYQDLLKTSKESQEGRHVHTGAVAIAMTANKPLVPMAFDVESSVAASRNLGRSCWALTASAIGVVGGLMVSHLCPPAGTVLLGASLINASQALSKKNQTTLKANIGQPVLLKQPSNNSPEAKKAAIQESCNRMAESINQLQNEHQK